MFKSAEEREAERREREAREAQEAAATPVGAAPIAKQEGQGFLEVQLQVGGHAGTAGFGSIDGHRSATSSAATLAEIERLGWRLEHASYFFMVTGETSTARVFLSGEATAVSGVTVGVYLFRNTDAGLQPPG
jgi:hypothetical protein